MRLDNFDLNLLVVFEALMQERSVTRAARRLNVGRFVWPHDGGNLGLSREQLDALVLGLPWQRLGEAGIIRTI